MAIFITSIDADQSTSQVISWLHYYNSKIFRFNENLRVKLSYLKIDNDSICKFIINGQEVDLDSIKSFWHRNGNFKIDFPLISNLENFEFEKEFNKHLSGEEIKLREYFNHKLHQKKRLGNIFNADINKLTVLNMANSLGICIPSTIITSSKKELLEFVNSHEEIICKPISQGIMIHDLDVGSIVYYTKVVTETTINQLQDEFTLSLFQEKIKKKYELRIVYFNGEFFSMAIFSQQDPQTSVDFRKYNLIKPNRKVPYNLPEDVKARLHRLMLKLELNSGSIDMAVTTNNKFVFFEVNPVGQFGMTSIPCNYYLEQKIAKYLSDEE